MAEASLLLFEFGSGTRANHGQAPERMSGTLVKDMSTILAGNVTGACADGTSEESPSRVSCVVKDAHTYFEHANDIVAPWSRYLCSKSMRINSVHNIGGVEMYLPGTVKVYIIGAKSTSGL